MSQANNKQKDGISIANIISVIGVIAFGILWGLSLAFITFSMTTAILGGAGAALLAAILLIFSIKFKQKESADPKWKTAEYCCLALLMLFMLASAAPFSHFMAIQTGKEKLQAIAKEDVENVRNGILDYQKSEENMLNKTTQGLKDAVNSSGGQMSQELIDFKNDSRISGESSVDEYYNEKSQLIANIYLKAEGGGVIPYDKGWKDKLDKASSYITSWSAFRLPVGLSYLESVNKEAAEVLPKFSEELRLPVIERIDSKYEITDPHPVPPAYDVELQLPTALKKSGYLNLAGIGVTFAAILLVAFNYLVAPRSRRLQMSRTKNEHLGRLL